jgi:hypothetical protein
MKLEVDDSFKKEETTEASSLTIDSNQSLSEIKLDSIDLKVEKEKIYNSDIMFGNNLQTKQPFRLGNTLALFYYNGEPLIIIGPHCINLYYLGPFYICLMSTISIICYFFFTYLWEDLHWFIRNLGVVISLVQILSYSYTALANPGIPNKVFAISNLNAINIKNKKICTKCQIVLIPEHNVEHCSDCGVCIEGRMVLI